MIDSFIVTSRETLEASLVVGIVLAYLHKTNNHHFKKSVYYGIIAGIAASILAAILFISLAGDFKGFAEQLFEGTTMLLGAALITTMIFWMLRQKNISKEIESKVEKQLHLSKPIFSHIGIFTLISVAILREGVETVIFLNAINYASGINFLGGTIGIISAIIVGYLFFLSSKKINLRIWFNTSSVLLILFAAGLTAHGVHELVEANILPPIISPVWDINPKVNADGSFPLLHENGLVGSFMKGLFGYNGNPDLIEIIAYLLYFGIIFILYKKLISRAEEAEEKIPAQQTPQKDA